MSSLFELLRLFKAKQIEISLRNGELHLKAPKGALSPELQNQIKAQKQALIDHLKAEKLDFSLFFFGKAEDTQPQGAYELLFRAAQFAEKHGFCGIWTPERHFDSLGAFFPSPAVLAAALARETKHMALRAGSVVLPLQDPIRVVEEWSVVDHLSSGRVELSFATGWHSNDFALAPENYRDRHQILYNRLQEVHKLWRGESIPRQEGSGSQIQVQTYPRPLQPDLPVWLTAIGNPDSYRRIGASGSHLLTCLLDQEVEELAEKLILYRQALSENGFDPQKYKVGVFLHTFLGHELEQTRREVEAPFKSYLKSTLHLLGKLSHSAGLNIDPSHFDAEEEAALLDFAFERYFSRRALMGTPESVQPLLAQLKAAGVNEIACLMDFGPTPAQIMRSLELISPMISEGIHQRA